VLRLFLHFSHFNIVPYVVGIVHSTCCIEASFPDSTEDSIVVVSVKDYVARNI
jgi:hypothetical protein